MPLRAAIACPLVAFVAWVYWCRQIVDLSEHSITPEMYKDGIVWRPDWFTDVVKSMPRRRLNDSERAAFRRDGAILIKGLMPNRSLLSFVNWTMGDKKGQYFNQWHVNGVVHDLIKYGPFAELSASALNVPEVTIWNAQLEPRPGKAARPAEWPHPEKPWYDEHYGDPRDMSVHEDTDAFHGHLHKAGHFAKPQASIFLALTDCPHCLELLRGSHIQNQRHGCRRQFDKSIDMPCMDRLERDCHGYAWWDMEAGDAILFYGSTFHWTILQEKPRKSLSIRYVPADMMFTGFTQGFDLQPYTNWKCGPIGGCAAYPIFYSNDSSRMRDERWPLWPKNWIKVALLRKIWETFVAGDPRCGKIFDS